MNIDDIQLSVSCPALIRDPFVKRGTFKQSRNGRLEHYTGGFTVVFPVVVNGEQWAFRCWYNDLGNTRRRFETLAQSINGGNLPYLCDFNYEEEGIVVNGKVYPTTRMKWVDGLNLKRYICQNAHDEARLKKLAHDFLVMTRDLHQHHIAHGDLQHGNILIDPNGKIFLIDYDSVYVPSLGQASDIIHGLKGYQHPARFNNAVASEKLDYFSELIIYTSILGIAQRPSFISEYDVENTDVLLFTADDFKDIKHSKIYSQLCALGDEFKLLMQILEEYLAQTGINKLEPFDVLMDRYTVEPQILKFECASGSTVLKGEPVEILYDTQDATRLYLDGKEIDANAHSYQTRFASTGARTLTLKAVNGLKQVTRQLQLTVEQAPTISLTLSAKKHRKGKKEQAVLTWNIAHAQGAQLSINGHNEDIALSGSRNVSPDETTVYKITATALDGKHVFKKATTLNVFEESKIDFTVDKKFSFASIPVTLQWNVTNAKWVKLDGETVEHTGHKIVELDKDTTFTLTAQDEFEIKEQQVEVRMLPLPSIVSLTPPAPHFVNNTTVVNHVPRLNANISVNVGNAPQPHFVEKPALEFKPPQMVFKKPKLVPLHVNVGSNWKSRLKTAINIITNNIEQLKFEEDEHNK